MPDGIVQQPVTPLAGWCRDSYETGGVGMSAMESALECSDGWGASVSRWSRRSSRQFDFGVQPPVFFFDEGGPCPADHHGPIRIVPKRGCTGEKANRYVLHAP